MTTTATSTDLDRLAAVIEHAKQHGLADTIGSIGFGGFTGTTVFLRGTHAFIRWAKSLGVEEISRTDDSNFFCGEGKLTDGSRAEANVAAFNTYGETPETLEVLLRASS